MNDTLESEDKIDILNRNKWVIFNSKLKLKKSKGNRKKKARNRFLESTRIGIYSKNSGIEQPYEWPDRFFYKLLLKEHIKIKLLKNRPILYYIIYYKDPKVWLGQIYL